MIKQKALLRTILEESNQESIEIAKTFNEVFSLFLFRKIKRITEATYIISNHFKDTEPIRRSLREEAIFLLDLSVKLSSVRELKSGSDLFESMSFSVIRSLSLLEVAVMAGLVSEPNYILINRELNLLLRSLNEKKSGSSGSNYKVSSTFFNVDIGNIVQKTKVKNIKDESLESDIDKRSDTLQINEKGGVFKGQNNDPKETDRISVKDIRKDHQNADSTKGLLRTVERLNKEKSIKDLFDEEGKKMTVRDIAVLLPKYSEKTIQRELSRLVLNGSLLKTGQKRWTTYFLKKS